MTPPIRKTRHSWNEPGHAHFLTYSCCQRLPLLSRDRSRQWVLAALEATRRELDVALWAYVVMPEHVHVLLCPRTAQYEMRRILVALKRPVADGARARLEQTGQARWLERLTVRYPSRTVFRFWGGGDGVDVVERSVLGGVGGCAPADGSAVGVGGTLFKNSGTRGENTRPGQWHTRRRHCLTLKRQVNRLRHTAHAARRWVLFSGHPCCLACSARGPVE